MPDDATLAGATQNSATDIVDQNTLEKAIEAETAKIESTSEVTESSIEEEVKVQPKETVDDSGDRYKNLRKDYEKVVKELKEIKAKSKSEEVKTKLASLTDYDEKLAFLAERDAEKDALYEELKENLSKQQELEMFQADQERVEDFITSDAELKMLGKEVQKIFRAIATSNDYVDSELSGGQQIRWNEVKLEDIKKHFFKPMVEKLSGTKITVKERPLRGNVTTVEDELTPEAVAKMSSQEYEKNRSKILRMAGVRGI